MDNYSRPLDSNQTVENFLHLSLRFDYKDDPKLKGIISRIVDGELGVSKFNTAEQTLTRTNMRDEQYRSEEDRWKLRQQIIDELFTKARLENDEKIKLKKGGALPLSRVVSNKQAFIVIGLPASGKSRISSTIADEYGAVVIDSDFAKRKLPEFKNHCYGASIVHEESSQITFGFTKNSSSDTKSLYELCLESDHNIVIPKIGQNPASIISLANALKQTNGYEVHLILVALSKRDATIRAIKRYAQTKRYVPLGLIFDGYGNDPSHCYYYIRCKHGDVFKSTGALSTADPQIYHVDVKGESPVLKYEYKEIILQLP